jgi:hypothetical protein
MICGGRTPPLGWLRCHGMRMATTDSSKMLDELPVKAGTVGAPPLLLAVPALELVDQLTTSKPRAAPESDPAGNRAATRGRWFQ